MEHEEKFAEDQDRNPRKVFLVNIRKRFGARVAGLRDDRDWTQEHLAAISDISTRSISNIENGVYSVTLDTAYKLARAFGIPLSRLFDI